MCVCSACKCSKRLSTLYLFFSYIAEASSVSTVDRVSAQWSEGQTVLRVTWEPVHTASLYIVQYSTHGGNVRMFNTTNTSFVITDVAYSDGLSLSVTYEENNKG